MHNNHCHRVTTQLQFIVIIIKYLSKIAPILYKLQMEKSRFSETVTLKYTA